MGNHKNCIPRTKAIWKMSPIPQLFLSHKEIIFSHVKKSHPTLKIRQFCEIGGLFWGGGALFAFIWQAMLVGGRSPKHTLGASPSHLPISIGAHNMNDLQRSNPKTNFKAALLRQESEQEAANSIHFSRAAFPPSPRGRKSQNSRPTTDKKRDIGAHSPTMYSQVHISLKEIA